MPIHTTCGISLAQPDIRPRTFEVEQLDKSLDHKPPNLREYLLVRILIKVLAPVYTWYCPTASSTQCRMPHLPPPKNKIKTNPAISKQDCHLMALPIRGEKKKTYLLSPEYTESHTQKKPTQNQWIQPYTARAENKSRKEELDMKA